MRDLKQDAAQMQELIAAAYRQAGTLAALADSGISDPAKLQRMLEQTSETFEQSTLLIRRLCEAHTPNTGGYGKRPAAPHLEITGAVEQIGYGWLHICLSTLLPHCRYQSPAWLSDTIRRLLDAYETGGHKLPYFEKALLVIDEHSAIEGRRIFDQDNKGWKAVSNVLKGRLIPDDDQYTLAVALLSQRSQIDACHIILLDIADAADFFTAHSGHYAAADFYGGCWTY